MLADLNPRGSSGSCTTHIGLPALTARINGTSVMSLRSDEPLIFTTSPGSGAHVTMSTRRFILGYVADRTPLLRITPEPCDITAARKAADLHDVTALRGGDHLAVAEVDPDVADVTVAAAKEDEVAGARLRLRH